MFRKWSKREDRGEWNRFQEKEGSSTNQAFSKQVVSKGAQKGGSVVGGREKGETLEERERRTLAPRGKASCQNSRASLIEGSYGRGERGNNGRTTTRKELKF